MTNTNERQYLPGQGVPYHEDFEGDDGNRCFHCNRAVGKSGWGVVIVDGGAIGDVNAAPGEPGYVDRLDGGYMGVYRIGSTCRKQFPSAIKHTTRDAT